MSLSIRSVVIGLLSIASSCCWSASADAQQTAIELFNARDLDGWKYHTQDKEQQGTIEATEAWRVQRGMLVNIGREDGYLETEKEHENYVLTLEWIWPGGLAGNSGVFVHVDGRESEDEQYSWPKSIEVDLCRDEAGDFWLRGRTLAVSDQESRKQDVRIVNLNDGAENEIGEWNKMEITCKGKEIVVKVNGKVVNRATDCSATKGKIALQAHKNHAIVYRNIKLTPIQ